jgi:hypothetical protein
MQCECPTCGEWGYIQKINPNFTEYGTTLENIQQNTTAIATKRVFSNIVEL